MLHIRYLFLTSFITILFVSSSVQAQTCSPCGQTIDLTVPPYSTGTAYTAAVTATSNQTLCIVGPATGTPATFNPTSITFNGTNNVCFSGKIDILSNITTAFGKKPIIVFQAGSVITHSGTFDLTGAGNANKTFLYNYGTYSNTNTTANAFSLNGTELYNSGSLTTSG